MAIGRCWRPTEIAYLKRPSATSVKRPFTICPRMVVRWLPVSACGTGMRNRVMVCQYADAGCSRKAALCWFRPYHPHNARAFIFPCPLANHHLPPFVFCWPVFFPHAHNRKRPFPHRDKNNSRKLVPTRFTIFLTNVSHFHHMGKKSSQNLGEYIATFMYRAESHRRMKVCLILLLD